MKIVDSTVETAVSETLKEILSQDGYFSLLKMSLSLWNGMIVNFIPSYSFAYDTVQHRNA